MSAQSMVRGQALHGGARVRFEGGRVALVSAAMVPPDAAPSIASVVSPGTELRRMRATVGAEARDAGYMTIAQHPGTAQLLIVPAPHGSWIDPNHPRAVKAEPGTAMSAAAVARFQLIAALGLRRAALTAELDGAVVVGSGPVALGCCLELRRLGAHRLTVWSRRPAPLISALPGVELTCRFPRRGARLVLDATGRLGRAMRIAAPGATVGLLGTPAENHTIAADRVHRDGLIVVGMHELIEYDHATYQRTYTQVLRWLLFAIPPAAVASWCLRISGNDTESFYRRMSIGDRPEQPIVLLEWR